MMGEHCVEVCKSGKRCHATLDVGVVDHNVSKDFTRIELLVPAKATIVLVCGPTAVLILESHNDIHSIMQSLLINIRKRSISYTTKDRLALQED